MNLPSPEITWFVLGIVLLAFEMALPGFVIFFFGVGALLTAAATLLFPINLNGQLIVFLISSLASLFLLRKYIKRTFFGVTLDSDEAVDSALASRGERAEVVKDIIPPAEGKVKYSGTTWRALSEHQIDKGQIVTIMSQDGLIMHVKKES